MPRPYTRRLVTIRSLAAEKPPRPQSALFIWVYDCVCVFLIALYKRRRHELSILTARSNSPTLLDILCLCCNANTGELKLASSAVLQLHRYPGQTTQQQSPVDTRAIVIFAYLIVLEIFRPNKHVYLGIRAFRSNNQSRRQDVQNQPPYEAVYASKSLARDKRRYSSRVQNEHGRKT